MYIINDVVLYVYNYTFFIIQACVIKRNVNINIFLIAAYGEGCHQYINCHNNYQYQRHPTFI